MSGASKGGGVRGEEGRLRERGAPVASGVPSSLWLGVAGMCVNRQALAGSLGCCEPSLAGSTALSKAPALGRGASLSAFFCFSLCLSSCGGGLPASPAWFRYGPSVLCRSADGAPRRAPAVGTAPHALGIRWVEQRDAGRESGSPGATAQPSAASSVPVATDSRPSCFGCPPPAPQRQERKKKKMTAPPRGRRAYPRRFPAP